jgi:hypothetical protein
MLNIYPPTTTTSILVNTRTQPKIVYLPAASTIGAGRMLFIKDMCGNAANSSIYLSTTGRDSFDGRNFASTSYALMSTNFQAVLLAPDGLLNWMILQNYNSNAILRPSVFSPTQIVGLQLWLDGSDSSSMVLSDTTITTWRDKSGNSNNTTNRSGTTSLVNNAINGLSVASFTNTWFTGPFATAFTGTQIQCFAVATMNSSTTAYGRILALAQPGANDFNSTTGQFSFIRNNGTQAIMVGRNGSYLSTAIPAYATPFLVQSGHNGAIEFIGVNGTLSPSTQNTGVASGFNITGYGVGTNTNTGDGGGYWHGQIAEVLYYTGLFTTLQRQQIEGYLAWKWGLQALLPSGHPYKNAPP